MRRSFTTLIAAAAIVGASPALAQDDQADVGGNMSAEKIDEVAEMMASLFQAEPLTAEQEARLPAAEAVVGAMTPDGFYSEMIGDMIDKMIRPMMSMVTAPEFVMGARLDIGEEAIEALNDAEQAEIVAMLDPAHDRRVDAILAVLTGKMGHAFATMEEPMRAGLSRAYAVRFDNGQLADIGAFFETPTGSVYARESMALFADPQVVQASMQALPAIMGGFGNLEMAMNEAMASLPDERAYGDLSPAERTRMADLLGVKPARLQEIVKPPKPIDGPGADAEM